MRTLFIATLALTSTLSGSLPVQAVSTSAKPTILLVHGAFAESASWNAVISKLSDRGYSAIAVGNPLRGVASDAAAVSAVAKSISGPVVLVGHSYGGPVITAAANDLNNVKALVYVAGFVPDAGESATSLSVKFPGSTLVDALTPVALPGGGQDLYIRPEKFRAQFAADVSAPEAALMAATQRPVTQAALAEASGAASWKRLPSYVIYGSDDMNIPAAVMKFMAERAHTKKAVELQGASHALMVSRPDEVSAFIAEAASAN